MNTRNAHTMQTPIAGLALAAAAALFGCSSDKPSGYGAWSEKRTPSPPVAAQPTTVTELAQTPPAVEPPQAELPPTLDEARAARREGIAHFDAHDYVASAERLAVAVRGLPDDAQAHYLLGLALWKADRADEAEPALARSAEIETGSVRTWINLARVRMSRDDSQGALEAADAALALDPASVDGLHQRGRALAGLGRIDEALEVLNTAHTTDPENGWVANTFGWVLLQAGRAQDAVGPLETARQTLPGIAFVRNNLGVAYERSGLTDLAVEEFRAAVAAGDSGGKAGASLARLGRTAASEDVQIAAGGEPSDVTGGGANEKTSPAVDPGGH